MADFQKTHQQRDSELETLRSKVGPLWYNCVLLCNVCCAHAHIVLPRVYTCSRTFESVSIYCTCTFYNSF